MRRTGLAGILLSVLLLGASPSRAISNIALDAVLAQDDVDVDFIEKASRFVTVLKNQRTGGLNSGVFVFHPERAIVIANYHLISSTSDPVEVFLDAPGGRMVGFLVTYVDGDPANDIAAFELNPKVNAEQSSILRSRGFRFADDGGLILPESNLFIDTNQFADESQLQRGREIFFLGYPLERGIAKEIREIPIGPFTARKTEWAAKVPIARFGRIASSIQDRIYLIDAMVNHGNSGSPVFMRDRAPRPEGGTRMTIRLVGIIRGFVSDNITYTSSDGHVLLLPHNSGLGEVVSAAAIRDVVSKIK